MTGNRTILIVIALLLLGILGFLVIGVQHHRTPGQKIGDGLQDIGNGVSDAAHNASH